MLMKFVFHGMLGFAVGIVVTGVAYGAVSHGRSVPDGASGHRRPFAEVQQRLSIQASLDPPMPLLPRYGEQVAGGSSLVWHLADGTDGARIELSRSATFDEESTHHFEVDGERLRLPAGWPAGVWYWRLSGRTDGVIGDRTSPTWMIVVPQVQAQVEEE